MDNLRRRVLAELNTLQLRIEQTLTADRYRFRQRLRRLRKAAERREPLQDKAERLGESIERSIRTRQQRLVARPVVAFQHDLPILDHRAEIAAAVECHQVVVVCGDTGSGKSTQLPKICLDMGRGVDGMIGHTQPRRIAARTIAARLADELNCTLGDLVGYKIRFTDTVGPQTFIKLMTDGILLAESAGDPFFNQYDTLILDEVHERSLNIDFLLGYLKRLLPKRPDLRCIITSATIDPQRMAEHFLTQTTTVPIIEVSGRTYPVEVRYQPPEPYTDESEPDVPEQVVQAIEQLTAEIQGDFLVFLPTERAIREVAKAIAGWNRVRARKLDVLPLYARLPAKEQNRVFAAHAHQRVVLATNVAESSLTVPGICAVIDTGMARIRRYSARSKVERLPIESISRASADQRKGRCGRIGPGICVRLYDETDYLARDAFTTPEIRRANLAQVILQTLAYRLGPIEDFPFVDPPHVEAIRDGYKTLFEIGAIDTQRCLTSIGRVLGRLPVDPRIGRMILAADAERCVDDVLIIGAALEAQDPRERPVEKADAADAAHAQFVEEKSDFASYLKLWDFYHHLKDTLSRNQLLRACRQNFLSYNRLREWADIYRQLRRVVQESGRRVATRSGDLDAVHRALLTGLLSGVSFRDDGYQYTGSAGVKLYIWPGSVLFRSKPLWIMAAEQVETTRRYCRTVAQIQPEWIEPLAKHLVKYSYQDPHWSRRKLAPMVWQRVTLYGLPIIARRRVALGPVDPETARQLFIQNALVEGQVGRSFGFLRHNADVLRDLEQLAARQRRTDWVVGDEAVFDFYDRTLPDDVYDVPRLRRWLKETERHNQRALRMCPEDFLDSVATSDATDLFPDTLPNEHVRLPLKYRFEPGHDSDGVLVTVPRSIINQLSADQLDWLVPGRLEEKITALIRSLPKSIRRAFVPAPDTARQVAARLEFGQGPFLSELARVLQEMGGETVPLDAFQLDRLPSHLVMKVEVIDDDGKPLVVDTDLAHLQAEYGPEADGAIGQIDDPRWDQPGVRTWEFGDVPNEVSLRRGGMRIQAFPALVVQADGVALRLVDTRDRAEHEFRAGLRALYAWARQRDLQSQVTHLPKWKEIRLLGATLPDARNLERYVRDLLADRAFLAEQPLPRTASEYHARLAESGSRIAMAVQDIASLLHPLVRAHHRARLAMEDLPSDRWKAAETDIANQIDALSRSGFLVGTPWSWLQQLPRFFQAIVYRIDKLLHGGAVRDATGMADIEPWSDRYTQRAASHSQRGIIDPELVLFRWMIEELRVSRFAQPLGTSIPVSPQRLEKQWARVSG